MPEQIAAVQQTADKAAADAADAKQTAEGLESQIVEAKDLAQSANSTA